MDFKSPGNLRTFQSQTLINKPCVKIHNSSQTFKMNSIEQINIYRKMLRYTIALILSALIVGTCYYLYHQYQISHNNIDTSREYIYLRSWEENFGTILSMQLPVVLLFAFAKLFILKRNENYWLNVLLIVTIAILFFGSLFSLTWGIRFKTFSLINTIINVSPYLLFPFFLIQSGKFISLRQKPYQETTLP